MADTGLGALGEGFETGTVKEQTSEASEADMARVQETLQKAKQMRGQIQQQVQQNRRLADLFALLLQYVDDDRLMAILYEQFSVYGVSIEHIFAQFLPWMMKHRDLSGYEDTFGQVFGGAERMEMNVSGVVAYLRYVRKVYGDVGGLNSSYYTSFVLGLLRWSRLLDITSLEEQKQAELKASIKRELEG